MLKANSIKEPMEQAETDGAPSEKTDAAPRRIGSSLGMKILSFIMRYVPFLAYGFALIPVVWYFWTKPAGRRAVSPPFGGLRP